MGEEFAEKPDRLAPLLAFRDFSFTYQSQSEPTLCHINLEIKQGEKVLILGPSGSGKSTLIHCINGLIPHAFKGRVSGELVLSGGDAAQFSIFDISKKIGTVLQDTDGQFVGLSAAEDIAFALENDCVPAEIMRLRVREAARLVDMESFLEQSPHDLSGGQK
ncbi:MAG: energy-coupling factor ABC transporter ATP-binding protein, partial [Treponema sp.]|nr:energy-coupling factor ABC transporter ATP-binding protein [Treponema sp.]